MATAEESSLCFSEMYADSLNMLIRHDYMTNYNHHQSIINKTSSSRWKMDLDEMVVEMNCSENYNHFSQNELQATHFYKAQTSVHSVVITYNLNGETQKKSIVFISCIVEHIFKFVRAVQIRVIAEIKKIAPRGGPEKAPDKLTPNWLQKHFYIKDGLATQYKNNTNFLFLSQHKIKFGCNGTWVFHATSYSKGAHDRIEGTNKSMLRTECLTDISIKNICDAYNFLLRKYETEETKIQPFMLTSTKNKCCSSTTKFEQHYWNTRLPSHIRD